MEKQLDAILHDLSSVQTCTKRHSVDLLCNLILLSSDFTLKFGQKLVAALPILLVDEFAGGIYDRLF